MARPRRLYTDADGKFYYIINKKKVLIKVPKGATMKQVQKVNIKNIVNVTEPKRIKRRKKKVNAKFQRVPQTNLLSLLTRQTEGGLPYYIFKEQQQFPTIDELSKKAVKTEPMEPEPKFTAMKPEPEPKFTAMKPEPFTPMKKKESATKKNPIDFGGTTIRKRLANIFKTNRVAPAETFEMPSEPVAPILLSPTTDRAVRSVQTDDAIASAFASLSLNIKPIKGKGVSSDDGLYNDQIEKVLKKRIKDYVPVIPADKTNDLLKYVARGDKRFGAVVNTVDSNSDGTGKNGNSIGHWTSVFINNADDFPTIEYFDPLVQNDIPDKLYNTLRKIARKMNPEMMFKFKPNMIRRQDIKTSTCGYHSMKFLDDRYNNIAFHEASGYDNFIEENKGADDSLDGEKDIAEYKKKYSNYI